MVYAAPMNEIVSGVKAVGATGRSPLLTVKVFHESIFTGSRKRNAAKAIHGYNPKVPYLH